MDDGEHIVDDVVELLGQLVDVLPVERRDEARVEPVEDLAGELVALPLTGYDPLEATVAAGDDVAQVHGAVGDVGRRIGEQLEEPVIGRQQSEPHDPNLRPRAGAPTHAG